MPHYMNKILLEIAFLNKTLSSLFRVIDINIGEPVIYKSNIGAYLLAKIELIDAKNPNKVLLDNGMLIDKIELFKYNLDVDLEKYKHLHYAYYNIFL